MDTYLLSGQWVVVDPLQDLGPYVGITVEMYRGPSHIEKRTPLGP